MSNAILYRNKHWIDECIGPYVFLFQSTTKWVYKGNNFSGSWRTTSSF